MKQVTFKNSGFYFKDCVICHAMGEAEDKGRSLSLEELKMVFRKAKGIKFRSAGIKKKVLPKGSND